MTPRLSIEYGVPSFLHGYYSYVWNLRTSNGRGRVCLKRLGKGIYETHSSMDDRLHGQGYGILMYSRAIRFALCKGFSICSSEHVEMTPDAECLWESKRLRREFVIRRDRDRFRVVGYK